MSVHVWPWEVHSALGISSGERVHSPNNRPASQPRGLSFLICQRPHGSTGVITVFSLTGEKAMWFGTVPLFLIITCKAQQQFQNRPEPTVHLHTKVKSFVFRQDFSSYWSGDADRSLWTKRLHFTWLSNSWSTFSAFSPSYRLIVLLLMAVNISVASFCSLNLRSCR